MWNKYKIDRVHRSGVGKSIQKLKKRVTYVAGIFPTNEDIFPKECLKVDGILKFRFAEISWGCRSTNLMNEHTLQFFSGRRFEVDWQSL